MHGNVSFIELGTSNTERSRPFFQRVFGWTFTPMAQGGGWFQLPRCELAFTARIRRRFIFSLRSPTWSKL